MRLLIAMKGHPGCGKSAVAAGLGAGLRIPVIDKDDIKDLLVGHPDPGGLAYVAMFRLARRQLLLGLSAVCDSPLSEEQGYVTARRLAGETGVRLVVIECVCSSQGVWRQRIEQRVALGEPAHGIASWSDLEQHLRRRAESSRYPIVGPHLTLDTVGPRAEVAAAALEWVRGHLS